MKQRMLQRHSNGDKTPNRGRQGQVYCVSVSLIEGGGGSYVGGEDRVNSFTQLNTNI